ncbi:hypothetical protein GYMLUDRAFT_243477 [Collybiopsis luxurians FD-317 M1]|uniref:Uncharacterized protein n=1 Tax=Collybiopsis luxurians FD-317 M1 TaxID=944289 RepID=A0A0D0CGP6_9AGAR|nr:hypothetical protein GYMLUDRAFT_243477 [Collybiopsis luxurians FD-317 M1]
MKVSASILATTLAWASWTSANPVKLVSRVPDQTRCVEYQKYVGIYNGAYEQSCVHLVENCKDTVINSNITNPWTVKSCVAAATCEGIVPLIGLIQCTSGGQSLPDVQQIGYLDYPTIYAGIVGSCAWQEGGCPINQQNYIDFVYGALSDVGTDSWPDINNVINNWWKSITQWTATGDTVPYMNFSDWLHYSNSGN